MNDSNWSRNLAILLTPPGPAAIAVVRLHGTRCTAFLRSHFSKPVVAGRPVHGELCDGDRVLDDPVVVMAKDAAFADLNLHGGPWIVQSVLELARREGFEVVERAGAPLPDQAVSEAPTELEREVLAYLPLAKTRAALRALLAQPSAWAQVRANPQADLGAIAADRSLWWLLHPPRVAIVGAPNVGKSTLANRLFAQERSITADLPGTTRDWVGEIANLDGLAVVLVDTPGIRQTEDAIERAAIETSAGEIRAADLVVLVLDATRPLEPDQAPLLRKQPSALRIINKCDLPAAWDLASIESIHISASTGKGMDAVRSAIRARFGCEPLAIDRPRCWTDRQRAIVQRAMKDPSSLEVL